jgi:PadR family transcriptional regulator
MPGRQYMELMEPGTLYYRIPVIMRYAEEGRDNRVVQLRKGIIELAVMAVLYRDRHYGYSLVRVLTEDGTISLKEGTIYPILARLDRDGLVRSEWVESDQGPPRKYYALSPAGRRLFSELTEELDLLVSLVKNNWGVRENPEASGKKLLIRKR